MSVEKPVLEKPFYGSPCNACGRCCFSRLCVVGEAVFKKVEGPCPALIADGDKRVCGLVKDPGKFAPARVHRHGRGVMKASAELLIGAGVGCDAILHSEPENPMFRDKLNRHADKIRKEAKRAARLWGIK